MFHKRHSASPANCGRPQSFPAATESFTDADLARFKQARRAESVATDLQRDPIFLQVVAEICKMEPGPRALLLEQVNQPLHQTWAELGEVSKRGQTGAGQQAESLIAAAIVGLVQELVRLPDTQFRKLFPG